MATRKQAKGAAKRRAPSGKSKTPLHDDAAVIHAAVGFAQSVAAQRAGYNVDPGINRVGGGPDVAQELGNSYRDRSRSLLKELSETPAKSREAIEAKARLVPLIFDDAGGDPLPARFNNFFRRFAQDVRVFLDKVRDDQVAGNKAGAMVQQS